MTIRHFRIFQALCQSLNMTRTAETLCMTQPSVSQAVAELEKHYQSKLFERLGKKLFLTEAGSELLTRASDILALYENTELAFLHKTQRRCVRLGASATVGSFLLPRLLRSLRHQAPALEVDFMVGNTAQTEAALLRAELDLALVEGRTQSPSLRSKLVLKDELVLVGHPALLPSQRHYQAKDLAQSPFLMRESGSGTAEQALETLAQWGIAPRIAGTVNSIDALHRLARAGVGFAFLPRVAVAQDLEHGDLAEVRIGKSRIERSIRLVHHVSKRMEGDLALVRECALELGRP